MHLSVVGTSFIVLSSREAIIDLLEKKSTMYSDRPVIPMAGELYVAQHAPSRLIIFIQRA